MRGWDRSAKPHSDWHESRISQMIAPQQICAADKEQQAIAASEAARRAVAGAEAARRKAEAAEKKFTDKIDRLKAALSEV
jgi:hypothetical protein